MNNLNISIKKQVTASNHINNAIFSVAGISLTHPVNSPYFNAEPIIAVRAPLEVFRNQKANIVRLNVIDNITY